ncbi:MAG: glycosyltransferase family 4 protein [Pseudomonadota bacterium]
MSTLLIIAHHLVVKEYQNLVQSLAKELMASGVRTFLITPKVYKEQQVTAATTLENCLFTHVTLHTVFGKAGRQHAHFYRGLKHEIKVIAPDLIYCMEEPNSLVSMQVAYIAKHAKVPLVLWSALNNNRNYQAISWRSWKRYLFPLAIRYCFDNTKAINALDDLVAEVLTTRGYTGLIFIQNTFGIEARFCVDRIRIRDSDRLEILYVGVLERHKGVDYLINAVRGMANIRLRVIGNGSQRATLEELAGPEVEFCGFIPYSRIHEVMQTADILVLPSIPLGNILEQFGRVLIEAMASGLCVIGSNIGGIPAVIAEAGIVVPPADSTALRESLQLLQTNPQKLTELKEKSVDRAISTYGYDKIGRSLAQHLLPWF